MLRLYKPIEHDIFTLHSLLKVVCDVWCTACNDSCDSKLEQAFKNIYHYSYNKKTLKDEVERIYAIFKTLSQFEKDSIKAAWKTNNEIENLCNGAAPAYLVNLPDVVKDDIKPLFKWCYKTLLDQRKVAGDKMDYYNKLIKANDFATCPCCGLIDFEPAESKRREAYDHYLPKAIYPFASVNFKNLVPLCYKCNSDRKKTKDPIENDRIAFYPFSTEEHNVEIHLNYTANIDVDTKELNFTNLKISLTGQAHRIETWDWLFDIAIRYEDRIKSFSKQFLKELKKWDKIFNEDNEVWTYEQTINRLISNFEFDYYDDKKFLKIAFLKAIKDDTEFMAVYE